jgi:hypothetical protein
MEEAEETVVLSRSDRDYLRDYVAPDHLSDHNPRVLLCALREDMRSLALQPWPEPVAAPHGACSSADQQGQCTEPSALALLRPYLTCVVRLAPEKEPHR